MKDKKCHICKSTIKIEERNYGQKDKDGGCTMRRVSKDGVFFLGRWFCNDCLEQMDFKF